MGNILPINSGGGEWSIPKEAIMIVENGERNTETCYSFTNNFGTEGRWLGINADVDTTSKLMVIEGGMNAAGYTTVIKGDKGATVRIGCQTNQVYTPAIRTRNFMNINGDKSFSSTKEKDYGSSFNVSNIYLLPR